MKKLIKKILKNKLKLLTVILCILSVGPHLTSTTTCDPVML